MPVDPKTALEALAKWDAGEIVHTVEIGGMGPGYEQCIHISVFEIIRDHAADSPLEKFDVEDEETRRRWRRWGDDTLKRINVELGLSDAQWASCESLRLSSDHVRLARNDFEISRRPPHDGIPPLSKCRRHHAADGAAMNLKIPREPHFIYDFRQQPTRIAAFKGPHGWGLWN